MKSLSSHTKQRWSLFITAFCAVWLGLVVDGFGAAYIKFDGIDGEATDSDHQKWIEIESFDHRIMKIFESSYDPLSESKQQHLPFRVRKRIDKATPKLMESCATGVIIPQAILEIQPQVGNPFIWKRIVFEEVLILSVETEYKMSEHFVDFTFEYERIHWRYVPKPSDEVPMADPVDFGWDIVAQSPFVPVINGEQPTPTPEPTPPIGGNGNISLQSDFFHLLDDQFNQNAVVVQDVIYTPLETNVRELYEGQFYPMITLPDRTVLTAMLASNIPSLQNSLQNQDSLVLVMINEEGQLHPFAEKIVPDVMIDENPLAEVQTILLNLSYHQDQLNILLVLRGYHTGSFERIERLVRTSIEGPFDATLIQNFGMY